MKGGARGPRHGIARVLSKRGVCSRTQATEWVRAGRVSVGGRVVRDPEFPTFLERDDIRVDGEPLRRAAPRVLMLNKPRGLVTSAANTRSESARPASPVTGKTRDVGRAVSVVAVPARAAEGEAGEPALAMRVWDACRDSRHGRDAASSVASFAVPASARCAPAAS